jgi:ABC-2 type transport system permease protein
MLTLIGRSLDRCKGLFAAVAMLLAAFQTALVAIATSFEEGQGFERLLGLVPAFLQEGLAPALASFGGLVSLTFYEPVIVLLAVAFAIYLAAEPAGDVESGLVDLLLARPLPRHRFVTRSLVIMTGAAIVLPAVMALTMWACLALFAPSSAKWPELRTVLLLGVQLAAVTWCFGGAGLAASAWSRRRGAAVATVGVAAVTMYLMDSVGDAWASAAWLAWLSPFHAFHGARILAGTSDPVRDLSVLFALGAAGVALAYWRFERRDV